MLRSSMVLACLLVACGGARPPITSSVANDDHWETALDQRLAYRERCGTGPFEIRFPAREVEWGRRITIEVHGPRRVPLQYDVQVAREDGSMRSVHRRSFGDRPSEHLRCRGEGHGEGVAVGDDGSASGVSVGTSSDPVAGGELEHGPMPTLDPWPGELPRAVIGAAFAMYPRGVPSRAGELDGIGNEWGGSHDAASGEIRVRVWLLAPSDLEGVVLRFRDQTLVPDLPRAEYEARFAERVALMDQRSAARAAGRRSDAASREAFCARYRCAQPRPGPPDRPPPPPLAETAPPAPSADVDWVPGFWSWDAPSQEYVWAGGTFVSRARAAGAAPSSSLATAPEPARELPDAIPPPPAPRAETVPPPPAGGTVWVAGHWQLERTRWEWIAGAWREPPTPGARPVAPSVRTRGGIRVYGPGGWIEVR